MDYQWGQSQRDGADHIITVPYNISDDMPRTHGRVIDYGSDMGSLGHDERMFTSGDRSYGRHSDPHKR